MARWQQHRKLVAVDTGNGLTIAHQLAEAVGKGAEHPVAHLQRTARRDHAEDAGLAYVHLVEPWEPKPPVDAEDDEVSQVFSSIREAYSGALVVNGNYDDESAKAAIEKGYADAIAFGRSFLANPDLPRRIREQLPINVPDQDTFYNGDEHGYTDYPTWDELQKNGADTETIDSLVDLQARGA